MSARLLGFVSLLVALGSRRIPALQRTPPSCEQIEAALRAKPDNPTAAIALGRCVVRDEQILVPAGDSSRATFRSNWAPALRALRHVVRTNPGLAEAYRPLMRMLFADMRDGCDYASGMCLFVAPITRDADSIVTIPRRAVHDSSLDTYDRIRWESRPAHLANLTEARDLASRWLVVSPDDYRPHEYVGRARLGLGDYESAAEELERAAALGTPESRRALFWDRMEALVKSSRGSDARRVLDEVSNDQARDTSRLRAYELAALNALLGRYRPPPVDSTAQRRLRARFDSLMQQSAKREPPRPHPIDTADARAALARDDSLMMPNNRWQLASRGDLFFSAQRHLALGDTVGAEKQFARIEQLFREAPFRYNPVLRGDTPWIGKAWLLMGDLMARRGRRDDAIGMYRRVVGLWGGASTDADVSTAVANARARLESLGSSAR